MTGTCGTVQGNAHVAVAEGVLSLPTAATEGLLESRGHVDAGSAFRKMVADIGFGLVLSSYCYFLSPGMECMSASKPSSSH